ncbi:MAG TPA: class I SAM-dependent methyltransferase [Candidatus Acidoferrum sp.]|nr:class I SAM-dependent methyltransferase [Candidatus Acidoferrum sp.]
MSEASRAVSFADAKNRFSNRVADYLRYRPHYPEGVLDFLRSQSHLSAAHTVADIGSGTGFLAELFLKNGNPVFGVEPNQEMREAGEEYLAGYPRFGSIDGSAEATTLPDSCAEFVTVGQAFHWFKPEPTRREFARILRPNGWVAIVWNDRTLSRTGFAVSYEELLVRYGTDYSRVRDSYPQPKDIHAFLSHDNFLTREIPNSQQLDLESLRGRLRSSSYVPTKDDPKFASMMAALDKLFAAHQRDGRVLMEFSTWVHLGQLTAGGSPS